MERIAFHGTDIRIRRFFKKTKNTLHAYGMDVRVYIFTRMCFNRPISFAREKNRKKNNANPLSTQIDGKSGRHMQNTNEIKIKTKNKRVDLGKVSIVISKSKQIEIFGNNHTK